MNSRTIQRTWSRFLADRIEMLNGTYQYPANESITDTLETQQDPLKRSREMQTIRESVPSGARIVCDFGCGVGRNFGVLRQCVSENSLFFGMEPDKDRAKIALRNEEKFLVLNGGVELLEQAPSRCTIDYFLCCQVVGHVRDKTMKRIVRSALNRLSDGGAANFCFPFVNSSLLISQEKDFFHVVNLDLTPNDKHFRIEVDEEEFDRHAEDSVEQWLLPVRAFSARIGSNDSDFRPPVVLDGIPYAFEELICDQFEGSATVYSVHAWHGDLPYVGDVSLVVKRRTC